MTKLILISGVSRSGKSTLAEKLCKDLPNALVIHQDEFILPLAQLPKIKDRIDWEMPETVDWGKLKKTLAKANSTNDYLIIEGIFTLSDLEITSAADHVISLKIDKSTFLKRRKMEARWGNEPDWFLEHVWESHLKFHNPHSVKLDVIIENFDHHNFTSILNQIRLL